MSRYRVRSIPETIAHAVRTSLRSPQYGHPAHTEMAAGYGPCRLCLRTFELGVEQRLLFTYQPFTDPAALPAPGPVFIHRDPCEPYDAPVFPETLRALPLVVEGYGDAGALVAQRRVGDLQVESVLEQVLEHAEVRYAHLRNADAGCFIARVDRDTGLA